MVVLSSMVVFGGWVDNISVNFGVNNINHIGNTITDET